MASNSSNQLQVRLKPDAFPKVNLLFEPEVILKTELKSESDPVLSPNSVPKPNLRFTPYSSSIFFANTVHITVLQEHHDPLQVFSLEPCSGCFAGCDGKPSCFHCPICPVSKFKPTWRKRVESHLSGHFTRNKGTVRLRGYKITGCPQLCSGYKETDRIRCHFHCAFCPRTFTKKTVFIQHLALCSVESPNGPLNPNLLDIEDPHSLSSSEAQSTSSCCSPSSSTQTLSTQVDHHQSKPQSDQGEHIRLKHMQEKIHTQVVTEDRHLFSCCVDASRGIYAIARTPTGPQYLVHVIKKTTGPQQQVHCDVRECMELSLIQWRSGNTSYLCEHLQSVPFAVPGVKCELNLDSLQRMVSAGFLCAGRLHEFITQLENAKSEVIQLLVKIPHNAHTSKRYQFYSIFTNCTSWWCKSERTIVTLDTKTSSMACCCQQKECDHRAIVKWWLFQDGHEAAVKNLEDFDGDDKRDEGNSSSYLPTGQQLDNMVNYIQTEKMIPLDACSNEFDVKDVPIHLIPPEDTCYFCSSPLSDAKIVCRHAKIVHSSCKPLTGFETYYKKCLNCHTPYRYQENCHGIFNYDDCLLVSHAFLMEIRAALVHHTAISRTVKALCYRLDVDLNLQDVENAYLAFEALQDHDYGFYCVLCGHHPKVLIHGITRKVVFDYEVSSMKPPEDLEPEMDVEDFWGAVSKEMIARGIVRDQPNPFKVKPGYKNWAPFMGKHTRAGQKMYNTEYMKVSEVDDDDNSPVPEELIGRFLHEEKLETIKRFCQIVGVSTKGSRIDLLCQLRTHSMTKATFQHAYVALHNHSGGWVSSTCPHNVTYAVKFLLHAESPRDYCDILRSMKHVPTVNIAHIADSISKMADKAIQQDFFHPNSGRLSEATQEYVEAAQSKRLEVSMPFLADDRPVVCGPDDHPVTGTNERYMLFDWFHETNTKEPVESLRRSSLVKELKGLVNTQAAEQFHRDKAKDVYFQNRMSPSNHIFTFRLITHLKNGMMNNAVEKRTLHHIPDLTTNPLGQLISADGVEAQCHASGSRSITVKPPKPKRVKPANCQHSTVPSSGPPNSPNIQSSAEIHDQVRQSSPNDAETSPSSHPRVAIPGDTNNLNRPPSLSETANWITPLNLGMDILYR
ncbi:uncharacterized protein LOC143030327 [Oratosquilla oratoria]|uniref:uncharacterized protein LOC143030327 n=1 Tax=Oratosquilla oratoria TaxID=337810 RepID=UPI003F76F6D5